MQIIVSCPMNDVILPHQIQWTDQLHSREIRTVQLRHHRLDLRSVEHSHHDRLDHIIKMMAKGDLIASKFSRLTIQMPPAHTRTQVTRRIRNIRNRIKNFRLEYRNRHIQYLRIIEDCLVIDIIVSRIHHKKNNLKIFLSMTLKFLKKLRHQHRILTARDTYCNLVAVFDHLVLVDCLRERSPDGLLKFLDNAAFHILRAIRKTLLLILIRLHEICKLLS